MLCFEVTSVLGGCLALESLKLDLWVVELSVGIDNLVVICEELEPL